MLAGHPSHPAWPASRYWATWGRSSVFIVYLVSSLYELAAPAHLATPMLVTMLARESGSMTRIVRTSEYSMSFLRMLST